MLKIKSVATGIGDGEGPGEILLDIHLSNNQALLVPLKNKSKDASFIKLYRSGHLFTPQTDGQRVYWRDGTQLTLGEILLMVKGE